MCLERRFVSLFQLAPAPSEDLQAPYPVSRRRHASVRAALNGLIVALLATADCERVLTKLSEMCFANLFQKVRERCIHGLNEGRAIGGGFRVPHARNPFIDRWCPLPHDFGWRGVLAEMAQHRCHHGKVGNSWRLAEQEGPYRENVAHPVEGGEISRIRMRPRFGRVDPVAAHEAATLAPFQVGHADRMRQG